MKITIKNTNWLIGCRGVQATVCCLSYYPHEWWSNTSISILKIKHGLFFGWIWDGSFVFCSCITDDFHMNRTSWTAISANTLSMKTRWRITGCHVFSPCNPVTHFWLADFPPSCPSKCIKPLNHIEPHWTTLNHMKPYQTWLNQINSRWTIQTYIEPY